MAREKLLAKGKPWDNPVELLRNKKWDWLSIVSEGMIVIYWTVTVIWKLIYFKNKTKYVWTRESERRDHMSWVRHYNFLVTSIFSSVLLTCPKSSNLYTVLANHYCQ